MLEHYLNQPKTPGRVVVLGAQGFIAKALIGQLQRDGIAVRAIGKQEIDLAAKGAGRNLAEQLQEGDTVVFLSALTPDRGKGVDTFLANVQMGAEVVAALAAKPPSHLVYVSSDAVYPLNDGATHEASTAEPTDLYGAAHLARELMLKQALRSPVAILRPTLIFGEGDTHNSYGANRFRRMARKDGAITLFGEGEETRDHIFIDDVTRLIELVLAHRSSGTLNLVTGRSVSFRDLARLVVSHFDGDIEIRNLPRQMPITHRQFDASAVHAAFPEFRFTSLEDAIAKAHCAD